MYSRMSIRKISGAFAAFVLCAAFALLPLSAFAGTLQTGYWGNSVLNKHVNGNENITITKVDDSGNIACEHVAYCFNETRGYPQGACDGSTISNEYEELALQDDATWKSLSENASYAGDMKDVLTKIVYIGYPYDSGDSNDRNGAIRTMLREDCEVDDEYLDDAFRSATQKAIWRVTDNRSFNLSSDGIVPTGNTAQVSDYIASIIYDRALGFSGDTGFDTRLWQCSGMDNRNQNLLDTSYNVAPEQPATTTGKLTITKTINGDAIPQEAKGALKFKVTAPDGTPAEYTLADFTQADGKYTLEITGLLPGNYLVEETAYDIKGYRATVTCSVDGAQDVKAATASVTVAADSASSIAFTDSYAKDEEEPASPLDGDDDDDADKPTVAENDKPTSGGNDKKSNASKKRKAASDDREASSDYSDEGDEEEDGGSVVGRTGDSYSAALICLLAMAVGVGATLLSRKNRKACQPERAGSKR